MTNQISMKQKSEQRSFSREKNNLMLNLCKKKGWLMQCGSLCQLNVRKNQW